MELKHIKIDARGKTRQEVREEIEARFLGLPTSIVEEIVKTAFEDLDGQAEEEKEAYPTVAAIKATYPDKAMQDYAFGVASLRKLSDMMDEALRSVYRMHREAASKGVPEADLQRMATMALATHWADHMNENVHKFGLSLSAAMMEALLDLGPCDCPACRGNVKTH